MEARSLSVRDFQLSRLVVATALAACVLLVGVSALLLARRLSGHFEAKLSSLAFLSVAAALLSTVAAPRLAGVWFTSPRHNEALRATFLILPAVAVLMLGGSLSFLSAPLWPLLVVWLAILAEEGVWWTIYFRSRRAGALNRARAADRAELQQPSAARPSRALAERSPVDVALETNAELIPKNVVQQFTRVREADGGESLHGVLRGRFAPGERTQNLHLAFCPPLASTPELSFEQIDGPPATIKAAQVESFGARLEVRLTAAHLEPADVLVEFSAARAATQALATPS